LVISWPPWQAKKKKIIDVKSGRSPFAFRPLPLPITTHCPLYMQLITMALTLRAACPAFWLLFSWHAAHVCAKNLNFFAALRVHFSWPTGFWGAAGKGKQRKVLTIIHNWRAAPLRRIYGTVALSVSRILVSGLVAKLHDIYLISPLNWPARRIQMEFHIAVEKREKLVNDIATAFEGVVAEEQIKLNKIQNAGWY